MRTFFKNLLAVIDEAGIDLIAAGVAYFAILAIFPALGALVLIASLFVDPEQVQSQMELWREIIPEDIYLLIYGEISALVSERAALGVASAGSLILGLWFARSGVGAMIRGINKVHGFPRRGAARGFGWTMLITILMILLAGFSMFAIAALGLLKAFLPSQFQDFQGWNALRYALAFGALGIQVGILYLFSPNTPNSKHLVTIPGAIAALVLCIVSSWVFSVYIEYMGSYNRIYGSLGAFAAMLVWMYLQTFFILLGAAINASIAKTNAASLQQMRHNSV